MSLGLTAIDDIIARGTFLAVSEKSGLGTYFSYGAQKGTHSDVRPFLLYL
jgi:hypothetical protein